MILVSGGTATLKRLTPSPFLGHLHTPTCGNRLASYWLPWACDNAAFTGLDVPAFLRMLASVLVDNGKPLWVTAPDVVGDSRETLRRFRVWGPLIRELGLPVAFVMQDGCETLGIPWDDLDAVFVGGSTEYKLSPEAAATVREAAERGKGTHMGSTAHNGADSGTPICQRRCGCFLRSRHARRRCFKATHSGTNCEWTCSKDCPPRISRQKRACSVAA
jgi:hypothetical protein